MPNLQEDHPEIWEEMLAQDWYQDGLDDQEATLVMIVGTAASSILGPRDLRGFLTKNHAESRMISLPLAGPTELVFFETTPNATNRVINHETAHFFWGYDNAPLWFAEMGADFLSSYVRDRLSGDSFDYRLSYTLASQMRYCSSAGMDTVQELIDDLASIGLAEHRLRPYGDCGYSMGENLFLNIFAVIGSDAVSAAWKDIYILAQEEDRPATEAEIYQAFLENTAQEDVPEFRQVYAELHGGSFSD